MGAQEADPSSAASWPPARSTFDAERITRGGHADDLPTSTRTRFWGGPALALVQWCLTERAISAAPAHKPAAGVAALFHRHQPQPRTAARTRRLWLADGRAKRLRGLISGAVDRNGWADAGFKFSPTNRELAIAGASIHRELGSESRASDGVLRMWYEKGDPFERAHALGRSDAPFSLVNDTVVSVDRGRARRDR